LGQKRRIVSEKKNPTNKDDAQKRGQKENRGLFGGKFVLKNVKA